MKKEFVVKQDVINLTDVKTESIYIKYSKIDSASKFDLSANVLDVDIES